MSITRTLPGAYWVRPSEKRLIEEARQGRTSSFDELVALHIEDIRKFVRCRVDRHEADDVVQEILMAVWKALPLFDGRSRFRTWVFGICQHKVKDHYRARQRRHGEVSLDAGVYEPLVAGPAAATHLAAAVRSSLATLPESQAEVIELYYQQNLTLAEVATVLNRNLNTVKYQFCQAHVKLSKTMKEEGLV